MKPVRVANNSRYWETRILRDLSFIKQHKRFPYSLRTLGPILFFGLMFTFPVLWMFRLLTKTEDALIPAIVIGTVILTMCISAVRYLGVLKFREIRTGYHLNANIALLKQFLQVQQLAFSVHPDAPEVFQIISKNISTSKDETREVMLFIADDKRILINSHFVGNITVSLPSRNYNEMCKRLAAWIERHKMENADTAIVTANY